MTDGNASTIGKYEIIGLLGEGGMGVVYKARDSVLDRIVAIKVMKESTARREDHRQRFLREARSAGSLQHPNVVTIHDLGEIDGHLFIAMEFIEGADLEQLIERSEPLPLQARLDIVIDVLTGLASAHKRGIIHRDIKPANIRVSDEGRAKIVDFGVAHLMSVRMTTTGTIMGTPSYMAPEMITEGKSSPASDIFAVGAVLYQVLTTMRPFEAPSTENLLFKIVMESPRPVSALMPELPPALDRIVQKAMAKDPSERYANTLDMANDLTGVRAKLSAPSYAPSVSLGDSIASAIKQPRTMSWRQAGKLALTGIGTFAAVSLIAIAWSQIPRSNSPIVDSADRPLIVSTLAQQEPAPVTESLADQKNGSPATTPPSGPKRSNTQGESYPVPGHAAAGERVTIASNPAAEANDTTQRGVVPAPPTVLTARRVDPPPIQEARSLTPAPSTDGIASTVEAYARAIESRNIAAVRRAYPGLTSAQQRNFEQLFQASRSITVTLRVANLDASGTSADARLVGSYDYITAEGREDHQPVSFAAALRHDGTMWRFVSMR